MRIYETLNDIPEGVIVQETKPKVGVYVLKVEGIILVNSISNGIVSGWVRIGEATSRLIGPMKKVSP
ncbi:hypothetical protein KIV65_gp42 [Mycobacterium phage Anthony]|uniref:Uncharacterized protein n=1 Tax=Mycobacterium phage Anthony TaxID=2599857 RepID=A0A5J6TI78_9CAUD|nr:hypothetical protein KIV65_gp42 [Mycobacterium phage Anthony]QFG10425.1 hypothetical protein PBI_ANTHONY_55 [Mycobacterium phage Anthony]